MRTTLLFNHDWLFIPEEVDIEAPDSAFIPINLPHTNQLLPHHNFDDAEYQFISTYRKRFRLPEARNGRRIYLDFDGAMIATTVTINGHTFPEHRGGYTPFSYDITDFLDEDGENVLQVRLDSTERKDIPPFGHTVDYLTFGGIYRDVHLRYVAPVHITNVCVRAYDLLSGRPKVTIDVYVRNQTDDVQAVAAAGGLEFWKTETTTGEIPPQGQTTLRLHSDLSGMPAGHPQLWTLDNPKLYMFTVGLYAQIGFNSADERQYDSVSLRYGFREAQFRADGFYLNGERLQLFGLNRHQTYPYIGAAAPSRLQRQDADILKYELGCNIVRTSHYPQSPHFLDRCDEIGLLVFEEIPGWQHIGNADWKALSLRDVRAMIERDWNHPSIILWGVRINESFDDTDFYTQTNRLARELDPTRQTGGVRFWAYSEFLEDVYTMNDFSNSITEPTQSPWLVTEFNGHMFPTKSYDHEARRVEHALRHARIHARQMTMGGVSGAIGWCAFDYNTHKEFGAGDRICYHGVMDIFRLPKWAAHFYASQQSPQKRIILEEATTWSLGDVDEGMIEPVIVFTNCDEVEVYIGEMQIGRYRPNRDEFPGLPHPPIYLTHLPVRLAHPYGDLRLIGYIGGQAVAERRRAADPQPRALILKTDAPELYADGMDMTRLIFKVADRYGNPLCYASKAIFFELDGPAELIGENPFPLIGGQAALYIKAQQETGMVRVRAHTHRLPPAEIHIPIIKPDPPR